MPIKILRYAQDDMKVTFVGSNSTVNNLQSIAIIATHACAG